MPRCFAGNLQGCFEGYMPRCFQARRGPRGRLHAIGPRRTRRQSCLTALYEGRTELPARDKHSFLGLVILGIAYFHFGCLPLLLVFLVSTSPPPFFTYLAILQCFDSWKFSRYVYRVLGPWWSLLLSKLKCEDAFLLKRGSLVTRYY